MVELGSRYSFVWLTFSSSSSINPGSLSRFDVKSIWQTILWTNSFVTFAWGWVCKNKLLLLSILLYFSCKEEEKVTSLLSLPCFFRILYFLLICCPHLVDHPDSQVLLKWIDAEDSPFQGMTKKAVIFDVKELNPVSFRLGEIEKTTKSKDWFNEQYTYLCLKFPFIRRKISAIVTIYFPSALTVIVSWISFWVDVESPPARVTLGIMPVLTIVTQIMEVRKILPPINYVTAIDIWLFVCLIFVVLSLCEFALSYHFVTRVRFPFFYLHNSYSFVHPHCPEGLIVVPRTSY